MRRILKKQCRQKMIPPDKIQKICSEYDVGNFIFIDKVPEGVLNDNYILTTTTGKYFIKSVREKAKDKLKTIYSVETLMKDRGIPSVVMLTTKSGDIFVTDDIEVYTLYPFIEAEKNYNYSDTDYRSAGEMLGKIHIAGSNDIPDSLKSKEFKKPSSEVILIKLKSYRDEINNTNNRNDADKLFLEYIDFKLATIEKIKEITLPNDTLIHGDYHSGNLLIDKITGEIIGVCDWEKAEFGSRPYELARSLLYTCFNGEYSKDKALADSKLFLEGYLSVFPMSIGEIMDGLNMRIYRMTLSSWIEEKYYKNNDSRANHLIRHEMNIIDYVLNGGLSEQIKNIATKILEKISEDKR